MADSYLDDRLREAFKLGKGSPGLAQRLLIEWAVKDQRLLLGMVRPFMRAIVTAAVEGAIKRGVVVVATPPRRPAVAPRLSGDLLDSVIAQMGRSGEAPPARPLAPAAGPGVADRVDRAEGGIRPGILNPPEQPAAGVGHVDAIRAIAAAFKRKHAP